MHKIQDIKLNHMVTENNHRQLHLTWKSESKSGIKSGQLESDYTLVERQNKLNKKSASTFEQTWIT